MAITDAEIQQKIEGLKVEKETIKTQLPLIEENIVALYAEKRILVKRLEEIESQEKAIISLTT